MGWVTAVQGRRRTKLDIISEGSLRMPVWIGAEEHFDRRYILESPLNSYQKTLPVF